MWKLRFGQVSGQSESIPTVAGGRRLTLIHRTKTHIPEPCPLQRTMSLPESGVLSPVQETQSDIYVSGYSSDPNYSSQQLSGLQRRLACRCKSIPGDSKRDAEMGRLAKQGLVPNPQASVFGQRRGGNSLKQASETSGAHDDKRKQRGFLGLEKNPRIPRPETMRKGPTHSTRHIFDPVQNDEHCIFDRLDEPDYQSQWDNFKCGNKPALRQTTTKERSAAKRLLNKKNMRPWRAEEESELLQHIQKQYASRDISWDEVAHKFGRTSVGCMAKYYSLQP
ncbi:hypothetical protein GQ54DRAFT_220878 [Martensiomyces pterosporus]|nr:hypothetical protein GQ54DRAFT_220878 [Martensiomyces pterosporus]